MAGESGDARTQSSAVGDALGRAVAEIVEDGVFEVSTDGRIARVNDALVDATGFDREALVGEPVSALVPEDHATEVTAMVRGLATDDGSEVESLRVALSTAADGRLPVELRLRAVEADDERGEGSRRVVGVASERGVDGDLSERRLVESLPGMAYRCLNEPGWPMSMVTGDCAALTGHDAAAVESGEVSWGDDVVHPSDRDEVWEAVQDDLSTGDEFEVTYRVVTADGETRWVWEQGVAVERDGTEVLEGFVTDVTERKRMEVERRLHDTVVTDAATAASFDAALDAVIGDVCAEMEWALAEAWTPVDGALERAAVRDASGGHDEFVAASADETFARGEGLPGRVWESGEAEWVANVADASASTRADLAAANGARAAFAAPIEQDGETYAVVTFYLDEPRAESAWRRRLLESVVDQLGEVLGRKAAEEALRESERRFRSLVQEVDEYAIFMLDEDGHVETWNDGAERIKGYDREDILGEHFSQFYTAVDRSANVPQRNLAKAAEHGRTEDEGWRVRADGSRFWANVVITALHDEEGNVQGYAKVTRDMTERREREQQLKQERERFRSLVQEVDEYAIFMLDQDGHVETWNDGAERIKGYDREDILGEHFSRFYTEAEREAGVPAENLAKAAEHGRTEDEGWRVRADGSRFWANVVITTLHDDDGDVRGYAKVTRDTTERREREQQLRRERDLNDQVLESSPVGIGVLRPDGSTERANRRMQDLLGLYEKPVSEYSRGDMTVYDPDGNRLDPGEFPSAEAFETGEPVYGWEAQVEHPDGERRWVSANAVPLHDDAGDVERVVVTAQDVTERRERERALQRERDLNEGVLETSPVSVIVVDRDGEVVKANSRAERRLGIPDGDEAYTLGDRPIYDEDGEFVPRDERPYADVLETGDPVEDWRCQIQTADGEYRWLSINAAPMPGDDDLLVVTGEDVTDLKRTQNRLARRRDELESELGELFGRVTDAFFALDEDWNFTYVNERAEELLDRDETELLDANIWEEFPEAAGTTFQEEYERAMENQEPVTFEEFYPALDAWLHVSAYPSETGISVYFRDVTDRKHHEQTLAGLHGVTQDLPHAETKAEVAERVVDAASDLLGLPGVTLYLHDDEAAELYPAAYAEDMPELYGELPRVAATADSSITGKAFVDGETVQYENVREEELLVNDGVSVRRNLFVPLGDHGVLIVGDESVDEFDEETVELAELLAADAESAMDRVDRETELRERERELERYETVVEQAGDGIYALDDEFRFRMVNEAYADLFGLEPEEMVGRTVEEVLGERFVDLSNDLLDALLETDDDHYSAEFSAELPDGEAVDVEGQFAALRDDDGELVGTAGVVRDVTERKARERELERYETIVETVDDGIYVLDEDGQFTMMNEAQARMLGYDREELLGEHRSVVAPEEAAQAASDAEAELLAGERDGATVETAIRDADDEEFPVETTLSLIDHDEGFERVGVVRDVTERKARERELERTERRFQAVFEDPNILVGLLDPDGTVLDINETAMEYVDADLSDVTDEPFWETPWWGEGDDAEDDVREWVERAAAGEYVDFEADLTRPDGERYVLNGFFRPVTDDDGEVVSIIVSDRDVTERREYERQLEESERRYRTLAEHFPNGIVTLFDHDQRYTLAAGQGFDDIPVEPDEVEGRSFREVWDDDTADALEPLFDAALAGEERSVELTYEGREWVVHAAPITDEAGDVFAGMTMARDITERKRFEDAIRTLHDTTRELFRVESGADVGHQVVTAASDVLGLSDCALYLHDDEEGDLYPAAKATDVGVMWDDLPRVEPGDDTIVGHVYETGESVRWDDIRESPQFIGKETGMRAGVYAPVGEHGAVFAGSAEVGAFDDRTLQLLELLAANAEAAFDRVERERKLERALDLLEKTQHIADVGGWEIDVETQDVFWSEHIFDLLEVDADEEPPLEEALAMYHEEDQHIVEDAVENALSTGESFDVEVRLRTAASDEVRWLRLQGEPEIDDGEVVSFRGAAQDVTERVERERALEESERRYRTLAEQFPDGAVGLYDDDLRYTLVAGPMLDDLGLDAEEMEGRTVHEVFPQETAEQLDAAFREGIEGETATTEVEFAGRIVRVWTTPVRDDDGEVFAGLSFAQDVTERVERQRSLEESERRYRTLAEQFPNGLVAMVDDDLQFTVAGGEAFDRFDYDAADVEGRAVHEVFEDDALGEQLVGEYQATLDGESRSFEVTYDDRDWSVHAVPVEDTDGNVFAGLVMAQDVTERKERERELELYETIVETVQDGVYVLDEEFEFAMVNDAYVEMTGYDRDELVGAHSTLVVDDDVSEESADLMAQLSGEVGDSATLEADIVRADGTRLPAESNFTVLPSSEKETPWKVGVVRDVSERVERERELRARMRQQAVTAELGKLALEEPDLDRLFEIATERVAETLDTEFCELLDLDADAGELLLRSGVGWQDGYVGSETVPADDGSQAGYTLQTEDAVVVEDLDAETRFTSPSLFADHDVGSGMTVIIGSVDDPWGVLGVQDTETSEFSRHDVNFLESVANVLATAIQRTRRVEAIERQRQHLAALDNLNGVVQDINVALAESSTREEIERAVCERLVDAEDYAFAWIGDVDRNLGEVTPSVWAGEGESYLDALDVSLGDGETAQGPTARAVEESAMQTTASFESDNAMQPWRDAAVEHGFESSAAIPLLYEGALYGVLNVYATRQAAFEGREGEVVAQLSEVVGHAIRAVERKEALMSESLVELEFRSQGVMESVLSATADGGVVRFDRTVQTDHGSYLQYVTVEGLSEDEFRDAVDASDVLSSPRLVTERSESLLFEVTLADPPVTSTVASHGGRVRETVVADGELEMQVEVPHSVDIRTLVGALEEVAPDVELVSQRSRQRDDGSLQRSAVESLTDKQLAAVEAAFFAGYFDWPRDSTAEDLAESMGVSAPTLHQHLRKGERKLLAGYFEQ